MGAYTNGREVDCDDHDSWSGLQPVPGSIVECHLPSSSLGFSDDDWAAFFVREVDNRLDGSILLSVHFMGASDPVINDTIVTMMERGVTIHLCLSRPCISVSDDENIEALHVTRVRFWDRDKFEADYLVRGITGLMKKWVKELEPRKKPAAKTPRAKKSPGAGKAAAAPKGERGAGPGKARLTAGMRDELKKKLAAAKKRRSGAASGEAPSGDPAGEGTSEAPSSVEEVSSSPEAMELDTGTNLEKLRDAHRERVKGGRTNALLPLEDTKGSSTKSLSGQLTRQALALASQRKKEKKKRRKKKKAPQNKLAAVLTQILTGSKEKNKEKMKKKKKKKRKRKTLKDGTIVSCSSSCSSSYADEEDQQASSESDLEAPIRKRSRDHPGSVLALLTSHVRETLDQAAVMDVPAGEVSLTGGVKVATYFALHIKPQFPTQQRELREMFSLAATLDLLRRGDIARVGDSLAARFMALHQALLDQNWGTARHMELHAMEETSAGSPSIVLASRKHSKLVDKVQGRNTGNWTSWSLGGRGRGKGAWKGSNDSAGSYKGEKGKGKEKGKKGKGKGSSWEGRVSEWDKTKEKPEDKQ